jgi:O-succinylbenzoic acid--CoA ligase
VRLRQRIALAAVQGIVYTSGTTGRPKGAMLTFGNHWASAVGSALHLGHQRNDRWLAMLPLFHVGGLAILFRGVIAGVPVVLHDGFDPARANRAVDEEGISLVSVVADMLRRMLDERGDRPYPPALRCLLLGGGPAPLPLLEDCLRRAVPVAPTYGLTEAASQVATLPPHQLADQLGSAGQPLPATEVRVEWEGRPVRPGEVGEIVVRGPTVMRGYLGAATSRAGIRRGGWFPTGDLGRLDAAGYLTVLDRRDDLIISGGENVYPAEVEGVLSTHPGVAEAAVVGVSDERWGQVPSAFVKRKPGWAVTEQELITFSAARLAPFKLPRRIEWVDALPRTAAGKLQRARLRADG